MGQSAGCDAWEDSRGGGGGGGGGGGHDPVSRTNFNQIHLSLILQTADFTNRMSFLAIFTRHGLIFPYFHASPSNFCPFHVPRINPLLSSDGNIRAKRLRNES